MDRLSGCNDFVTVTILGISKPFKYIRDCKCATFQVVFAVVVENMVGANSGISWWSTTSWLSLSAPSTAARLSWASDTVGFLDLLSLLIQAFFLRSHALPFSQGVTKRCRLSWLTNSASSFMSPNAGGYGGAVGGSQPISTAVYIKWHGAQINFGDLPPYLTYCRGPAAAPAGLVEVPKSQPKSR